ncbi:glyoxalase [Hydrocoleum sp. CS-953]|uniref:ArsI/CadI family heavy metal resistance metalloenzyme n=1 Tax=Hydrocoleum sp. CS-953 TaxID=1671698 RepID=UPI000B9AD5ED|nr:ArsI/CadI family heavy metal resistance metalloenzyme [Hydrocoleum sp. CS-953]OZH52715.1 glyoxalase [Hydrocoleum sp. CS-953]OZH54947.1 glyoxalase [Hydrocoleum sp. CS-953]
MSILKTHIALTASNLENSVEFYQALFGVAPVKYKSDYAKFDIANPPLNLTLNLGENVQPGGKLDHLGIQVETSQEVAAAIERFKISGLLIFEEHNTDCCYAIQDKVWVTDPDGNRWEVFVVKVGDTAPEKNLVVSVESNLEASTCCQ